MRYKIRRGFSLAEVVIAFVLISFLALIVGGVMTSSYVLSAKIDQLPNTYYTAQDNVEKELDSLKDLVKEKFRIQNELTNTPPGEISSELVQRLNEVNEKLEGYQSKSVTLFGKNVELFEFDYDEEVDKTGLRLKLHAGVANAESLERPVPIIDNVTVSAAGGSLSNEVYHAVGSSINAAVQYNSKNYDYYFRSLYQWYVCTGDFHTAAYATEREYEELLYGTVFAQYPNNFTLIPGATGASITVDESYSGKFLACVVTPLSIEGKMGKSVVSNFLYVSALPTLSRGNYVMVVEPSITTCDYNPSDFVPIDRIQSRIPTNTSLICTTSGRPTISLNGAVTDSDISLSATGNGNYSRYIHFDSGCMMRGGGLPYYGNTVVYVVARSNGSADVNFMISGGREMGFGDNESSLGAGGDSGWQILSAQLEWSDDFIIGGEDVDVGELILVSNPSSADTSSVIQYLAQKYHIS